MSAARISYLKANITVLQSEWIITTVKEAALRSSRSTAAFMAATSAWKTLQWLGSLKLELMDSFRVDSVLLASFEFCAEKRQPGLGSATW